jgi:hypothetical protein
MTGNGGEVFRDGNFVPETNFNFKSALGSAFGVNIGLVQYVMLKGVITFPTFLTSTK